MKVKTNIISLIVVSMVFLPSLLWAEDKIEVLSRVEIEVIKTNEQGQKIKELVPAERVIPGETVIYTNTVTNIGQEPVEAVTINNPVPEHTDYIAGSAFGQASIIFSADDGRSFAPDGEVTIIGENGEPRAALPKEYTNIRWRMNKVLKPGERKEVGFRVRLQ